MAQKRDEGLQEAMEQFSLEHEEACRMLCKFVDMDYGNKVKLAQAGGIESVVVQVDNLKKSASW